MTTPARLLPLRGLYRFGVAAAAVLTLAVAGCRPAARFPPPPEDAGAGRDQPAATAAHADELPPLSPELLWRDARFREPRLAIPILFVHEQTNADEWKKLDASNKYWTQASVPARVAAGIGGLLQGPIPIPGLLVAAPDPEIVKIKVPRGLDDPTPLLPAANPPTLAKWHLGHRLFFDSGWLSNRGNVSCAGCHIPELGFTDNRRDHDGFNTPTLINVAYQSAIFWDGRGRCLEEVVARTAEDERLPGEAKPFRHAWGGTVTRLAGDPGYRRRFDEAFGTLPTQDAIGKALATYLRTLLAGDSLHDRACRQQTERGGKTLEAGDYARVLDAEALKTLGRAGEKPAEVAADLAYGYRLFHNLSGDRKLNCINCHGGRQFTDGRYHNVGAGYIEEIKRNPFPGRFPQVPIGLKDRHQIGAYKTPTLRGLLRTAPYFHTGEQQTLEDALTFHTQTFHWNECLAPEMVMDGNPTQERHLNLSEVETRALLTFLKALNGGDIDPAVGRAPVP